jgi:hypothetical protein
VAVMIDGRAGDAGMLCSGVARGPFERVWLASCCHCC